MRRPKIVPAAPLLPPSLDDIEAMARAAFDALPAAFRERAGEVVFCIEDFPSDDVLQEMGEQDAFAITGLYQGEDLTQRSVLQAAGPSMVFLYRRPILDEWAERGDTPLHDLVAHIVVHEIGHHFGLSDAAMDALLEDEP